MSKKKKKTKAAPWNHPDLPARLTEIVDEVSPGAILKRMPDSVRAIVIDYDQEKNQWLVVMAKRLFRDESREEECKGESPRKPGDYTIKRIRNTDEWLVLRCGTDILLID